MRVKALFLTLVANWLLGQSFYYYAWQSPGRNFGPRATVKVNEKWFTVGSESNNNESFFAVFLDEFETLERAYDLNGASLGDQLRANDLLVIGDTVYIVGQTRAYNQYGIIASFTKGTINQNPNIIRVKAIYDENCLSCTFFSYIYDLNYRNDTIFAVGTINKGDNDVLLLMLNKNLDTLKAIRYSSAGSYDDYANRIYFAKNGDLLIIGTSYASNSAYGDILVMRVKPDGQVVWSKLLGYEDRDYGLDIYESESGNIYVLAYTNLGTWNTPNAAEIFKLAPNGALIWHKYIYWGYNSTEVRVFNWKFFEDKIVTVVRSYSSNVGAENRPYVLVLDTLGNVITIKEVGPVSTAMHERPVVAKVDDINNKVIFLANMDPSNAGYQAGLYTISVPLGDSSFCFKDSVFSATIGQGNLNDVFVAMTPVAGPIKDSTNNSFLQITPVSMTRTSVCDTCTLPKPTADFSYTDSALTVNFTNNSSDATEFLWDFGDGNTSEQPNPTHTYANPGTYDVCLIAMNDCDQDTLCQSITITPVNIITKNVTPKVVIKNNTIRIHSMPSIGELLIYSIDGRQIMSTILIKGQNIINVENLQQGLYIYKIIYKEGHITGKFIIQN